MTSSPIPVLHASNAAQTDAGASLASNDDCPGLGREPATQEPEP